MPRATAAKPEPVEVPESPAPAAPPTDEELTPSSPEWWTREMAAGRISYAAERVPMMSLEPANVYTALAAVQAEIPEVKKDSPAEIKGECGGW